MFLEHKSNVINKTDSARNVLRIFRGNYRGQARTLRHCLTKQSLQGKAAPAASSGSAPSTPATPALATPPKTALKGGMHLPPSGAAKFTIGPVAKKARGRVATGLAVGKTKTAGTPIMKALAGGAAPPPLPKVSAK
eukprot:5617700-Pyramimonas_sp.AAC.1